MKATQETTQALKKNLEQSWQLLKALRDELRLELHLAGMDARTRLEALEPRFAEAERVAGNATAASKQLVTDLLETYRFLRDEVNAQKSSKRPN